jgi:hypothetical protein
MTFTSRIGAVPSASATQRVSVVDAVAESFGGDAWGETWGGTWGSTWFAATAGVSASPAVSTTARIGASPAASITNRISGVLTAALSSRVFVPQPLQLEGDETANKLLFEEGELFSVEGDAESFPDSATKRVAI